MQPHLISLIIHKKERVFMYPSAVIHDITNFIFCEDKPARADMILIPGGGYPEIAERAAALFREGFAPLVLPSGKYSVKKGFFPGALSKESQYSGEFATEWAFLKNVLMQNGVPEEAILKEDRATYTYQNAIFSREVTDEAGLTIKTAILCCQAFHARRSLSYYRLCFPETQFLVCPAVTKGISRDTWFETEDGVDTVLGELTKCGSQFGDAIKTSLSLGSHEAAFPPEIQ